MDSFIYISTLAILVGSAFVVHSMNGAMSIRNVTPIGFFIYTYSIYLVGTTIIYFSDVSGDPQLRVVFLLVMFVAPLGVLIGSAITAISTQYKPSELSRFLASQSRIVAHGRALKVSILIVIVTAASLWVLYSRVVDEIPALYLLRGDVDGAVLRALRASGYKELPDYITHPMNLFRFSVMPFWIVMTYLVAVREKSVSSWTWFLLMVVCGVIYNSYTTAMYPIVMLFAILFLTSWTYRLVRASTLVALALPGVLIVIGFQVALSDLSVLEATQHAVLRHSERFFITVPDVIHTYVSEYLTPISKLSGAAHRPFAIIGGMDFVNVSNHVFLIRNPEGFASGHASVPFHGYLYADFGVIGVLSGGIVLGILLQGALVICVRGPTSLAYHARYALLVWLGYAVPTAAVTTGLISKGFIPIMVMPMIFAIWVSVVRHIKASVNRQDANHAV